jgi:very-short-patch-repair endonuclease
MIQKFIYGHTDSEKFTKLSKTLTKEILNKLYIEDKLSACQIAKEYKVFSATIISLLKKYKIETRTYLDSQKLYHSSDTYLKNNALHSIRMKENNPMFDEKHREKFYKTIKFGEENRSWKRKKIVCDCCGKSRYLKPSMYKKLVLNGICWNCYKHSRPKSSLEIKMKEELIRRNIEFKEQVPFKGLFLDFVLPNNIVIEVDGEYWHNLPENKARDQRKDKLLKQDGYKLFRFTDKQINTDIKLCVDKILK